MESAEIFSGGVEVVRGNARYSVAGVCRSASVVDWGEVLNSRRREECGVGGGGMVFVEMDCLNSMILIQVW